MSKTRKGKRKRKGARVAIHVSHNDYGDANKVAQAIRAMYNRSKGIVSQFAGEIGLSKRDVSRAFRGAPVNTLVASKISRGLGYEVNQLFTYPRSDK